MLVDREESRGPVDQGGKKRFSVSFNGYLIIPIILFEIVVCFIGANFFKSVGYSTGTAITLSVSIESFYMFFASRRDFTSQLMKIVLLLISVTTLSYSAYSKDEKLMEWRSFMKNDLVLLEKEIMNNQKELFGLSNKEKEINKDMEVYRKHDLTTKGNRVLSSRRENIKNQRSSLLKEIKSLKLSLNSKREEMINQNVLNSFGLLTINTLITILVFSIIQICICISLPEVVDSWKKE